MGKRKLYGEWLPTAGIIGKTTGNFDIQLGDAAGSYSLRVVDSSTTAIFTVDSDGNWASTGTGTVAGTLTASSGFTVTGTLTASSNASVANTLTASSNVSVAKTLTASSNVTISGTLTASSNTTLSDTVTASTDVTVQGTLTASSNTTLSGTVSASTNVTVSGTLTASSASTLTGTVSASSNVTVSGTLTASSNASVANTLTASSNVTVSGTLTASSQWRVANESVSTGTSTSLVPYGLSKITCTTSDGGASAFTLTPPTAAGQEKFIFCVKGASSAAATVGSYPATVFVNTATAETVLDFSTAGQLAHLISANTSQWILLSATGLLYGSSST